MRHNINKKLAVLYLLIFLLLPGLTLAVWDGDVKSVVDNVVSIVEALFGAGRYIYFLWYAIMFLKAKGDPTKVKDARQGVLWGVVGVILGGIALTIVTMVTNTLGL